jgi:hypothetical protein
VKLWGDWEHSDRAVFINQLNQPHAGLDAAIQQRDEKWVKIGIDPRGPIDGYKVPKGDWAPDNSDLSTLTVDQFRALLEAEIDAIQAGIEAHEERIAIQNEQYFDGSTTTQRMLKALEEPDTQWGRHATATAWLRDNAPNTGIFRKVPA